VGERAEAKVKSEMAWAQSKVTANRAKVAAMTRKAGGRRTRRRTRRSKNGKRIQSEADKLVFDTHKQKS